jgi:membrane protein implicated in regulation of membrane protease activity
MTIKQYFKQDNRWLWHCLALVFNFIFWLPANLYNWLGLAKAKFNGLENSQYFLQGFLSLLITGIVAWLFENWQRRKKQKQTAKEWRENAVPDIYFTTLVGFIGFLLVLLIV